MKNSMYREMQIWTMIAFTLFLFIGCEDGHVKHTSERQSALSAPTGPTLDRMEAFKEEYFATAIILPGIEASGLPAGQVGSQSSHRGVLRAIGALDMAIPVDGISAESPPENIALGFLSQWGDLFGIVDPSVELIVKDVSIGRTSEIFVHLDQVTPGGRPVFAHGLVVALSPEKRVSSVNGLFIPDPPDGTPILSSEEAMAIALESVHSSGVSAEPILGVYDSEAFEVEFGPARLAWEVDVQTNEPAIWRHYVDAETGDVLLNYDILPHIEEREVWWFGHESVPPPGIRRIWRYDPPYFWGSWPDSSEAVYNGNTSTYHYYLDRFERDSWDNNQWHDPNCHRLLTSSDWGEAGYHAAAWWTWRKGEAYFGDEAACTDIVGHEFTHGVNETEANLVLIGQSGSLAESFCDIFGEFIERYSSGGGPDWMAGTELSTPPDSCYPFHDLAGSESPSCEDCPAQPSHFSNYNRWGGVDIPHINAGIPVKSGWLLGREASQGASTFAGITVTGIGEVDAGLVWYDALTERLNSSSNFTQFRNAIISSAAYLFGVGQDKYIQALRSVDAIGIWSSDYWMSFDSKNRIALAVFTVSGQERRYIFYKEPVDTNPRLFYKYRICAIYGGCSWSSATTLDYAGAGPATVIFDGKLWVFYKYDLSNYIYYKTLDSSGNWSSSQRPTGYPTTDNDVAAVVYNGKMYLFYKAVGSSGSVYYKTLTPGGNWTTAVPLSASSTSNGPAAVAYNNYLRVYFSQGSTSPNMREKRMDSNGTWSSTYALADNLNIPWSGSPTAYTFNNRVHLAGRSSTYDIIYASMCSTGAGCTYRPGEWTWNVILDPGARDFVTLFEDGTGHLYLFFRDDSANAIYWRFKRSE